MDSRRKTGGDCCRLPALTRRLVLGRAASGQPGDALALSKAWLAIDAEIDRLSLEWQAQESSLATDLEWLRLPDLQR